MNTFWKKYNREIKIALVVLALYILIALVDILGNDVPRVIVTVLKKGCIYALLAVSLNLLNGFTGLFSLGQAGFMLIGAYTYAILTIPVGARAGVYYMYGGGALHFSVPLVVGLLLSGVLPAIFAFLIGLPVLKLKSDYLAIATLGFAEIVRALVQWQGFAPVTNGSISLNKYPYFKTILPYALVSGFCILLIVLLIRSTYGRALKAIRDDEVAAEAMGINLAHHKMVSFMISSFFAGIGGALLAMFQTSLTATAFTSAMTYEILLMVVIGGIGSVTGSILASFLFIACSEWWLRGLDSGTFLGISAPAIFRSGFRLVVFSVVIMIIVLFFRRGIMGERELDVDRIGHFFTRTLPHFITVSVPRFFRVTLPHFFCKTVPSLFGRKCVKSEGEDKE